MYFFWEIWFTRVSGRSYRLGFIRQSEWLGFLRDLIGWCFQEIWLAGVVETIVWLGFLWSVIGLAGTFGESDLLWVSSDLIGGVSLGIWLAGCFWVIGLAMVFEASDWMGFLSDRTSWGFRSIWFSGAIRLAGVLGTQCYIITVHEYQHLHYKIMVWESWVSVYHIGLAGVFRQSDLQVFSSDLIVWRIFTVGLHEYLYF